jgi:light-regulated signal transduction histidine kinase (bacteriophytochrome)
MSNRTLDAADLTGCDREPIHIPGSVQPHGALLALEPADLRIVQAGGDTRGLLGAAADALLGETAARLLDPEQIARLRALLAMDQPLNRPLLAFSIPGSIPGSIASDVRRLIDVIAHRSTGLLVLEFEPRLGPDPDDPLALVQTMIRHVQHLDDIEAFCDAVVAEIRAVTGFSRVMLYRFEADASGLVTAESRDNAAASFLGLRYPASDIPRQARALYLVNWIRMIPDARYAPAPILPELNPNTGRPLDLSQSAIRSVSAVHRQYLANMEVVASMSMSVVVRGRLWGLIACHHPTRLDLPYRLREALELFAEMASAQLAMKLATAGFEARLHSTTLHEELLTQMSQEPDLALGLPRFGPLLLDFLAATGVGLWIDGTFTGLGATPGDAQVARLVTWLNEVAGDGIFHTDCLPCQHAPAEAYADVASGVLALAISKLPRDYVLWFRPEVIRTVTWAGNPDKPAHPGPDGGMLGPRNSFECWRQSVRLHSAPWQGVELEAAHRLRLSLLEVVLGRIAQIAQEREAAWQQQQLLMRELDRGLDEWKTIARALRKETERRAGVEADLSQVLRRTVADQEAERQRIARELHDTLGQSLTLLQLGLDGISQETSATEPVRERVLALKALAAETGRDVNRLAWEIRPTALDDLGIQTAVRNFLETWSERSHVPFDLHLTLGDRDLPAAVESTLYRVLQEALTNVVRHAEATRIGVILGEAGDIVTMIVEDNGRGFGWDYTATNTPPGRRLGLLGIRERLSLVGGTLEVESAPGKGTTLFIRIPV